MLKELDLREVYRLVAYRPFHLNRLKVGSSWAIYRWNLSPRVCPYVKKRGASLGLYFQISVVERAFDGTEADPMAFVTPRCTKSKNDPRRIHTAKIKNEEFAVMRVDIVLNRDLFREWEADKSREVLTNRAICIAHELYNVKSFFEVFSETEIPLRWDAYLEWSNNMLSQMKQTMRRPTETEEKDLLCSRDSLTSTLNCAYGRYASSKDKRIEFASDYLAQQGSQMIEEFKKHWREEWAVSDRLLEERVLALLPSSVPPVADHLPPPAE